MIECLANIILTMFNEKISYATQLATQYAAVQNNYEKYKFVYNAYICVAFPSLRLIDKNSEQWDDEILDCDDYTHDIKKPKKERCSI